MSQYRARVGARRESGAVRTRSTLVGVAVAVAALLVPAFAFAVNGVVGSNFEIDASACTIVKNKEVCTGGANLKVDGAGAIDWASIEPTDDGPQFRKADKPSGASDDSFTTGSKEDTQVPAVESGSIPPNKSDLKNFGLYYEENDNGKFMHLFWHRVQEPSGTTNMDFEFNQSQTLSSNNVTPVRTEGDLLIQYDLASGGTNPKLWLSEWLTAGNGHTAANCEASNALPCWGKRTDLSAQGKASGSINSSEIPDSESDGLGKMSPRTFGEATIDFGDFIDPEDCQPFGSAYLKSRSSDSFTAAMKDFIAPVQIHLDTCGSITVVKQTEGDTGTFEFTSNSLGDGAFDLTTTDEGESGQDSETFSDLQPGTYDVVEALPDGWDLTSAVCDDGSDIDAIQLTEQEDITCTFVNTAKATLIVEKQTAPNGSSQAFTFSEGTGLDNEGTFTLGDGGQATYTDIDPGTYTVTETEESGWMFPPSIDCDDTDSTGDSNGVATYNLDPGETVTCVFTNTQKAKVTITKTDDDDPAAALADAGFTVYEDLDPVSNDQPGAEDLAGPAVATCTTDATGTCDTDYVLDPSKAYWVVESTTPDGYFTADPQRITPTAGEDVQVSFADPRKFKVITIVCRESDDSLYPSDVTLDGSTKTSLDTAPGFATEEQICSLDGATFGPKQYGEYTGKVDIPQ